MKITSKKAVENTDKIEDPAASDEVAEALRDKELAKAAEPAEDTAEPACKLKTPHGRLFYVCAAILAAALAAAFVYIGLNPPETPPPDIGTARITELRDAIISGKLTSREITEFYLDRIDRYNDEYNCFITMCDDALDIADKKDAAVASGEVSAETADPGLLYGIPVVVKDNYDYAGYPTTNGDYMSLAYVPEENSYAVQRLIDEGAIIIGKTNMSTHADSAGDSLSLAAGETLNAYNTELSPGGSSGGTAVAVSLNFAAAGLGSDTNSSLRLPAAYNGDVSLRPTWDLISTEGIVPLNTYRDVAGAISRSVEDEALMMDVLTDRKYNYYENLDSNALEGAVIGVINQLSYADKAGWASRLVDDEVAEAFNNAIAELQECGADIVYVDLYSFSYPSFLDAMKQNGLTAMIYPTCLSGSRPAGIINAGRSIAAGTDNLNALHMLSPVLGIPDLCLPIGNQSNGCGIGMEIVADKNQEQTLLNIACSYMHKYNHRVAPLLPDADESAEDSADSAESAN